MKKSIVYPEFTYKGITPNHRAFPLDQNLVVLGGDTETYEGEPMTLQLDDGRDSLFEYVRPETIFPTFRDWVFPRCRSKGVNVCYFHVLRFDFLVLFYQERRTIYEQLSEVKFTLDGVDVDMIYGKVNKATLRYGGKVLHVLDSWHFTQAGLGPSLKMYGIAQKKLAKPPRLGKVRYDELPPDSEERLYFEAYSKGDARGEQQLGVAIMDFHKRYKVRPSVSLPQFAGRVLRHHFMREDEAIPCPPRPCVEASQSSYHGGKNGYYLDGPTVVEDAYELDISSAYPFAMRTLPQFVSGGFARVSSFDAENVGVYRVSGRQDLKYPVVYTEEFVPVKGDFSGVWVTGHEVARMIRAGVDFNVDDGWVWVHDRGYAHNPLAEYVDHFYKLKEGVRKEDADYYFYKTAMNALYGKFCAAVEEKRLEVLAEVSFERLKRPGSKRVRVGVVDYTWDDVLGKPVRIASTFRAGLLTNFFIASQITGLVRGYLWDLETKYNAFHSATDSIKTTRKVQPVKGLGGLKVETFGRCYAFRNKLYLHYAVGTDHCGHERTKKDPEGKLVNEWRYELSDRGQHLCKYGLHGFKGTVRQLHEARHRLIRGEAVDYAYGHMVGLREGLRHRERPCSFVERRETFKLDKGGVPV